MLSAIDMARRERDDLVNRLRKEVVVEKPSVKRLTLDVEGVAVDVCLRGKPSTLNNGKWILAAMPNAAAYEQLFASTERVSDGSIEENRNLVLDLANELEANIATFNYPGVGDSQGSATPEMMGKAYKALLLI